MHKADYQYSLNVIYNSSVTYLFSCWIFIFKTFFLSYKQIKATLLQNDPHIAHKDFYYRIWIDVENRTHCAMTVQSIGDLINKHVTH